MLRSFVRDKGRLLEKEVAFEDPSLLQRMAWIDLLSPTQRERDAVSQALDLILPTAEKTREIESSSRFYEKEESYYMTVSLLTRSSEERPQLATITFILHRATLITLRYEEAHAFTNFIAEVRKEVNEGYARTIAATTTEALLFSLLDAMIDRIADILERLSGEIELVAQEIFYKQKPDNYSYSLHRLLGQLARHDGLIAYIMESLSSLERMVAFIELHQATRAPPKTIMRDLISLKEHTNSLSNKINFLLTGCLGVISIEQNRIIKIFSVAAVVFLPPTLVASIYGMNFHHMPELDAWWGYPVALTIMVASAVLPYYYFKRSGWV